MPGGIQTGYKFAKYKIFFGKRKKNDKNILLIRYFIIFI